MITIYYLLSQRQNKIISVSLRFRQSLLMEMFWRKFKNRFIVFGSLIQYLGTYPLWNPERQSVLADLGLNPGYPVDIIPEGQKVCLPMLPDTRLLTP